jgi:hypothetical protein
MVVTVGLRGVAERAQRLGDGGLRLFLARVDDVVDFVGAAEVWMVGLAGGRVR